MSAASSTPSSDVNQDLFSQVIRDFEQLGKLAYSTGKLPKPLELTGTTEDKVKTIVRILELEVGVGLATKPLGQRKFILSQANRIVNDLSQIEKASKEGSAVTGLVNNCREHFDDQIKKNCRDELLALKLNDISNNTSNKDVIEKAKTFFRLIDELPSHIKITDVVKFVNDTVEQESDKIEMNQLSSLVTTLCGRILAADNKYEEFQKICGRGKDLADHPLSQKAVLSIISELQTVNDPLAKRVFTNFNTIKDKASPQDALEVAIYFADKCQNVNLTVSENKMTQEFDSLSNHSQGKYVDELRKSAKILEDGSEFFIKRSEIELQKYLHNEEMQNHIDMAKKIIPTFQYSPLQTRFESLKDTFKII